MSGFGHFAILEEYQDEDCHLQDYKMEDFRNNRKKTQGKISAKKNYVISKYEKSSMPQKRKNSQKNYI